MSDEEEPYSNQQSNNSGQNEQYSFVPNRPSRPIFNSSNGNMPRHLLGSQFQYNYQPYYQYNPQLVYRDPIPIDPYQFVPKLESSHFQSPTSNSNDESPNVLDRPPFPNYTPPFNVGYLPYNIIATMNPNLPFLLPQPVLATEIHRFRIVDQPHGSQRKSYQTENRYISPHPRITHIISDILPPISSGTVTVKLGENFHYFFFNL